MNGPVRVLLIDDSPDDREAMLRMLARSTVMSYTVTEAEDGESALKLLQTGDTDCALLDFSMPGSDGLQVLQEMGLRFPGLPVVMMTGEGNERVAVEAFRNGVQDYVLKIDLSSEALDAAIRCALDRKRDEAEILRRANFDEMTGLHNRRSFNERFDHALARSGGVSPLAVIFLDLDGFKQVNDRYGHDVGDELLKQVADRAKSGLRDGDTVARLGGDEFVVLLENLPGDSVAYAHRVSDRLTSRIGCNPYLIEQVEVRIGVSTGMAVYPVMAETRSELLRIADHAMYADKAANKSQRLAQSA